MKSYQMEYTADLVGIALVPSAIRANTTVVLLIIRIHSSDDCTVLV